MMVLVVVVIWQTKVMKLIPRIQQQHHRPGWVEVVVVVLVVVVGGKV